MSTEKELGALIWGAKVTDIPHLDPSSNPFVTGRSASEMVAALTYKGEWRHRSLVETDRSWRQVIPYVVITNVDTELYLLAERTPKQAEERLHSKLSIGMGGHIEEQDQNSTFERDRLIEKAAWREIGEETGFCSGVFNFAGCLAITDPNEDEVHHVHIGVVYHLFTEETAFKGEDDKHVRSWSTLEHLTSSVDRMEAWSRDVFNFYVRV